MLMEAEGTVNTALIETSSGTFNSAREECGPSTFEGIPVVYKTITINGRDVNVGILTDLPWGRFLGIIEGAGESGGGFSKTKLLNGLLEAAIVYGIEPKNRSEMAKVRSLEMTTLIKEVLSVLPLQAYFSNLGGGEDLNTMGLGNI